ncbi:MAG: hypothetical protein LBI13_05880 [Streptococcaceae bacterium]|jgi:hypothetical protein|nr:hypothetical protein [Streptococcaceae bacterium]
MKKPKILTATFEESLNFEDDPLLKWQNNDVEQPSHNEKPVLLFAVTLVLIFLLYGMYRFSESLIYHHYRDSPISKEDINFLPSEVFWIGLVLFVSFWIYTYFKRNKRDHLFWTHINSNNMLIWMTLELNLLFVTMLFKNLTVWGILIMYALLGLIIFLFIRSQIRSIEKILFSLSRINTSEKRVQNKVIKYILESGGMIVLTYIVLKIIFPNILSLKVSVNGAMTVVVSCFIFNLIVIAIEICVEFPFQLQGYYRRKYTEEYRKWEGKKQHEWYGKKYFEKHIKGTNKEDKTEIKDLSSKQIINYEKIHQEILNDSKQKVEIKND